MHALTMLAPGGSANSIVRQVSEPVPGPGEISIDVAYAGVNFLDVMARRGDPGYATSWPFVPGIEVAGTVRAIGAGVDGFRPGQRVAAVTAGGGMATVAIADARVTVAVPDEISLKAAAAAPTGLVTALLLLELVNFKPGSTLLVHSASGGIGTAVARWLPLLGGGQLIGTVGRPERIADAAAEGYTALVRDEELVDVILRTTEGRGVDGILDPLGTSLLDSDVAVTAPGGRIVIFGNATGGKPDPLPHLGQLIGGNLTISGFSHRGLTTKAPHRIAAALERTFGHMNAGHLEVPVLEVPSLEDVPAVHQLMADSKSTGKYVVRIGGEAEARDVNHRGS